MQFNSLSFQNNWSHSLVFLYRFGLQLQNHPERNFQLSSFGYSSRHRREKEQPKSMVFFLCSVSCEVIVISIAADGKQLFANENTITLDEIS